VEWKSHRVEIRFASSSGGTLIVSRNSLKGWTARCDGVSIPVGKTSEGWIELRIPSGSKHLILEYFPPGFPAGILLSILGVLSLLVLWWKYPQKRLENVKLIPGFESSQKGN